MVSLFAMFTVWLFAVRRYHCLPCCYVDGIVVRSVLGIAVRVFLSVVGGVGESYPALLPMTLDLLPPFFYFFEVFSSVVGGVSGELPRTPSNDVGLLASIFSF
jgi:hypothetical protein